MKNDADKERILIVDDSPETLELLERNLKSEGYEVLTAPGAAEAIGLLDETHADLVITDYKMPKSSGMDLIRYIRENLKNVRETLDVARQGFYATMEQFKKLRDKSINRKDVERYIQVLIAPDKAPDDIATVTTNRINEIVGLAFTGKGNHGETMWDAFNAVTEYTSWKRARTQDARVAASWYGPGADMNARALEVALDFEPEKELVVVRP